MSPRASFHYNGSGWAEFTYYIRIPHAGDLCTGWRYPIDGVNEDEIPQRWSCRHQDILYFTEKWGGPRYPLPYLGDYEAVIKFEGVILKLKFQVLEGIPPG